MSLDQNLFTLSVTPHPEDASVLDLVDPSGNAHYRKQRISGQAYKIEVYDPHSESLLATVTAPSATSKHKTIELHNPSKIVELKYTGTLSFKWKFAWEVHEFEWKREECYILRKPDPAVLVAVTKEPAGRIKTSTVQILDYNLNRFDIDDRKGLEIVILSALLSFQDTNDAYHTPTPTPSGATPATSPPTSPPMPTPADPLATTSDLVHSLPNVGRGNGPPPTIPPKPAPKTGIERIAELHMLKTLQGEGEANEVEVGIEGTVDDYAKYSDGLLKDDAMLFITLRSFSAQQVPKVLAVVEQMKRIRHKAGIAETDPLFQYVVYDTPKPKGPKRINLDDAPPKKGYTPPTSLSVHLSKIDMPELQPRVDPSHGSAPSISGSTKPRPPTIHEPAPSMPVVGTSGGGKQKPEKEKPAKTGGFGSILGMGKSDGKKTDSKHKKDSSLSAPSVNKLSKPGHSPSHSPIPSSPNLMPAPTHGSHHPPSRPHSPYSTSPQPPFASPWSGPPPPSHPYSGLPEPGSPGGFFGGFGSSPPPPPPQHPAQTHGGYGGGYNPGYL